MKALLDVHVPRSLAAEMMINFPTLLVTLCLFLAGSQVSPGQSPKAPRPEMNSIVGTWVERKGNQLSTVTFSADHTYTNSLEGGVDGNHGTGTGIWRTKRKKITLTQKASSFAPAQNGVTMNGNILVLTKDTLSFEGEGGTGILDGPPVYKRVK